MITYDPRNWFAALALHRSDTFRKLMPLLLVIGLYTWGIAFLELKFFKLSESHHLSNITVMHSLLGFAISMLLVFRTNTAYDRWWEGRKLWGQLVNVSRNLAVKLAAYVDPTDTNTRAYFARLIALNADELRQHLQRERTRLQLDSHPHPEIPDFDPAKHVPSQISGLMLQRIQRLHREGRISGDQLIILNNELSAFLDICGACERIKNTPIPYSYTAFIKKFIVIYTVTLPLGFVFSLGYIAIPVVVFIFYVLASLELIAEEIEDPFGTDGNDLPMDRLSQMIAKQTHEILN
ncbi:MAG TPA: bestrophin family protein [Flavobacteriales bacterium]